MIRRPPRSPRVPYSTLFRSGRAGGRPARGARPAAGRDRRRALPAGVLLATAPAAAGTGPGDAAQAGDAQPAQDRKSTRLNPSHANTSYAFLCVKTKSDPQAP